MGPYSSETPAEDHKRATASERLSIKTCVKYALPAARTTLAATVTTTIIAEQQSRRFLNGECESAAAPKHLSTRVHSIIIAAPASSCLLVRRKCRTPASAWICGRGAGARCLWSRRVQLWRHYRWPSQLLTARRPAPTAPTGSTCTTTKSYGRRTQRSWVPSLSTRWNSAIGSSVWNCAVGRRGATYSFSRKKY